MHPNIENKVAVITGGSRGIGFRIAEALLENGARVVIGARHEDDVRRAAEALNQKAGNRAEGATVDVRDYGQVEQLMALAERKFGGLDILVNNAGIIDQRSFLEISLDEWNRLIEGNLTNAFLCCKAVLPHMVRQKWGRIINISSTSGLTGGTSGAHYAAAKAGIVGLTKALSSEFAPRGITVNAIVPSKIETEMLWRSLDDKGKEALMKKIPVGRFGKPEEIGCLALFLASERAGYITGETIVASGGYR